MEKQDFFLIDNTGNPCFLGPSGKGYDPTVWQAFNHPNHNEDHNQQRAPYHTWLLQKALPGYPALPFKYPVSLWLLFVAVNLPRHVEFSGAPQVVGLKSETRSNVQH